MPPARDVLYLFQFAYGIVYNGLGHIGPGERDELVQRHRPGCAQQGMLHNHGKTALEHRPGLGVIQQLPHRDLIVLQIQIARITTCTTPPVQI